MDIWGFSMVYLRTDGHLGFFHGLFEELAIRKNAAMNSHIQVLCRHVFISLMCISRSGIGRSYGNSMFNHLRKCHILFTERLHHFTLPLAMYKGSNLSTFVPTFVII